MFVRNNLLLILSAVSVVLATKNVGANIPFREKHKYKEAKDNEKIPGEYIVILSDTVIDDGGDNKGRFLRNSKGSKRNKKQKETIRKKFEDIIAVRVGVESNAEFEIISVYNKAIKGVSVKNLSNGDIQRLLNSDDVLIVQEVSEMFRAYEPPMLVKASSQELTTFIPFSPCSIYP